MSMARLASAIQSYTTAVKSYIQSRVGATVVAEAVAIPASSSVDYDLTSLLGAAHEDYDKLSAVIVVKVLDVDAQSPTYNLYVNAEAVVTVGTDSTGLVRVHNYSNESIDCRVRIDVPIAA